MRRWLHPLFYKFSWYGEDVCHTFHGRSFSLLSSIFFMSSNNIDGIILLGKTPPALIDWQYMLPYGYYSETVNLSYLFVCNCMVDHKIVITPYFELNYLPKSIKTEQVKV